MTVDPTDVASVFVGRRVQLELVRRRLQEVRDGHPCVIWIEGDAGVGKTALAHQVVRDAAGFTVVSVEVYESPMPSPLGLARDLAPDSARVENEVAAGLAILERLGDLQADGPVLVLIEDLQWSDLESRSALLGACRRFDRDAVAIVITSRPEGPVEDGWARFTGSSTICDRVLIGALGPDEVSMLAAARGVALSPAAATRLWEDTDGHALLVCTVVRELTAAELADEGGLPVPRSIAASISDRLTRLDSAARGLAWALAVLGARVPLAEAASVAQVEKPTHALEELLYSGLVTWWPQDARTPIAFTHPLYGTAVLGTIGPTDRQRFHRRAAEVVGGVGALGHRVAAADGVDDELSDELAAASVDRPDAEAAQLLAWSATLASTRSSTELRFLESCRRRLRSGRALSVAAERDAIEACLPSARRDLVLGTLDLLTGHAGSARRHLENAATAGADAHDVVEEAWGRLVQLATEESRGEDAVAAAGLVLASAPAEALWERAAWTGLAAGTAFGQGAVAGRDVLADRLPQDASDVAMVDSDLLITRGSLGFYAGRTTAAMADLRVAIANVRAGAPAAQLPRAHMLLAQVLLTAGDWDEATRHARLAEAFVSADEVVWMQAQVHAVLARVLGGRGRWTEAAEQLAAADRSAEALGTIEAVVSTAIARATVSRAEGDHRGVVSALQPLTAGGGASIPMVTSMAWWPPLIASLIALGDLQVAGEQIAALRDAAGLRRLDLAARSDGLAARLAAARGEADEAASCFADATAGWSDDDPVLDRAELDAAHGRFLLATGHRRAGLDRLLDALRTFEALGASPYVARTSSELALAGVRAGGSRTEAPLDLTERERDVAALVAQGRTNKQVAAELYISAKAVEYHLGNIFPKLGIRSRHEIRDHIGVTTADH